MSNAHSPDTAETHGPPSPFSSKPHGAAVSDETSPLLQREGSKERRSLSRTTRWTLAAFAFVDKNAGLLLVAASQFLFAASNVSVKWLNSLDEPVPILELIWVRMVIVYILSVSYMYWRNIPDPFLGPKGVRPLLVLRGYTGFTALAGAYFSLQHLSLSDAVVLKFLAPILTGFSGAIFLKEALSLKESMAGFYSFFGVILIARPQFLFGGPPSDDVTWGPRMVSVIAGLVGAVGSTGSYTLLRAIGKRAHALHVNVFFSSQCVLVSTIAMIIFKIPLVIPTRAFPIAVMFLNGIVSTIAQTLLAMGFQRETAARGTLAMYTSVIFAAVFEFFVFNTTPTPLSIAGGIVIMSSAIYISLTKKATTTSVDARPERQSLPTSVPHHDDSRVM